jgi:hypothetical protein
MSTRRPRRTLVAALAATLAATGLPLLAASPAQAATCTKAVEPGLHVTVKARLVRVTYYYEVPVHGTPRRIVDSRETRDLGSTRLNFAGYWQCSGPNPPKTWRLLQASIASGYKDIKVVRVGTKDNIVPTRGGLGYAVRITGLNSSRDGAPGNSVTVAPTACATKPQKLTWWDVPRALVDIPFSVVDIPGAKRVGELVDWSIRKIAGTAIPASPPNYARCVEPVDRAGNTSRRTLPIVFRREPQAPYDLYATVTTPAKPIFVYRKYSDRTLCTASGIADCGIEEEEYYYLSGA